MNELVWGFMDDGRGWIVLVGKDGDLVMTRQMNRKSPYFSQLNERLYTIQNMVL
jgi:hypothetical protein